KPGRERLVSRGWGNWAWAVGTSADEKRARARANNGVSRLDRDRTMNEHLGRLRWVRLGYREAQRRLTGRVWSTLLDPRIATSALRGSSQRREFALAISLHGPSNSLYESTAREAMRVDGGRRSPVFKGATSFCGARRRTERALGRWN